MMFASISKYFKQFVWSRDELSVSQLKSLEEFEYKSEGTPIVTPYLRILCYWIIKRVPKWFPPNLLTIIGLFINLVAFLIMAYHCPSATEEAPRWAYFFAGTTVFLYQIIDELDGIQGRRINHDTQLEELCDHGCDSVSVTLLSLNVVISTQLGNFLPLAFIACFISLFLFYVTHWRSYITNVHHFLLFDVNEGQLFYIGIFILSGLLGPSIWSYSLYGIQLRFWLAICGLGGAVFALYDHFRVILPACAKDDQPIHTSKVFAPFYGITAVILLGVALAVKSTVFERHPVIYVLAFGMLSSKITCKLLVARLTNIKMSSIDICFTGPMLLIVDLYFGSPIPEVKVLYFSIVLSTVDLIRYVTYISAQISEHLGIYCFHIVPEHLRKNCKITN